MGKKNGLLEENEGKKTWRELKQLTVVVLNAIACHSI